MTASPIPSINSTATLAIPGMAFTPEISFEADAKYSLGILKIGRSSFANFVYVVIDNSSRDAILVDPGFEPELILSQLHAWNANLRAILLTHGHADHTNQVANIHKNLGVPVYISEHEQIPRDIAQCSPSGIRHLMELKLGTLAVQCIHTPGHTAGSFCFQIANFLFTGDTLFNEGCGYCIPPAGSSNDMFESLRMLKQLVGGDVNVYPSHQFRTKPGLRMNEICKINPYLMMNDAKTFDFFSRRRPIVTHPMHE